MRNYDPFEIPVAQPRTLRQQAAEPGYGWLGRLNDRTERWIDGGGLKRLDTILGTIGGVVIVGFGFYLLYLVIHGFTSGVFQRAVAR